MYKYINNLLPPPPAALVCADIVQDCLKLFRVKRNVKLILLEQADFFNQINFSIFFLWERVHSQVLQLLLVQDELVNAVLLEFLHEEVQILASDGVQVC